MAAPDPLERLDAQMSDTADVFIRPDQDAGTYIAGLEQTVRAAICAPFAISATVVDPGFPDLDIGDIITGHCVTHRDGYWLVYQFDRDRFLCFWGTELSKLSAPGIFGSPLGCWSA